jgi:hypothetical protein
MAQERDPDKERLTTSGSSPSLKELYFELKGRKFLASSGYAALFDQSKTMANFDEVHRSWRNAIRNFNVGTSKNLKSESAEEIEQLETFFIELRHGDLSLTHKKYFSLIQKRFVSGDSDFFRWLTKTMERRSVPNEASLSLSYHVLSSWTHGFLWGLSNEDRVDVLRRLYGVAIDSTAGGESEALRKAIGRLKLKSWSSFRKVHSKPPFLLNLFREGTQELCQILFRKPGQE